MFFLWLTYIYIYICFWYVYYCLWLCLCISSDCTKAVTIRCPLKISILKSQQKHEGLEKYLWRSSYSVKLQSFKWIITKKWAHSLVFLKNFAYFFRNIYFKEHLSLTVSSDCIMVYDWYIFHDIIFRCLCVFSSLIFPLPSNKYTCFQKHVRYLSLRKLSQSGKSRTQWSVFTRPISIFYPILSGINRTSFFSIFFTKWLSNWAFLSTEKLWKY